MAGIPNPKMVVVHLSAENSGLTELLVFTITPQASKPSTLSSLTTTA